MRAANLFKHKAYRFFEVCSAIFEVMLDQMRQHFGVGLRYELVTFGIEHVLERDIVLDNPIVNYHDVARAVAMGVGIRFIDFPVRSPASVAYASMSFQGVLAQYNTKVAQLARGPSSLDFAVILYGY